MADEAVQTTANGTFISRPLTPCSLLWCSRAASLCRMWRGRDSTQNRRDLPAPRRPPRGWSQDHGLWLQNQGGIILGSNTTGRHLQSRHVQRAGVADIKISLSESCAHRHDCRIRNSTNPHIRQQILGQMVGVRLVAVPIGKSETMLCRRGLAVKSPMSATAKLPTTVTAISAAGYSALTPNLPIDGT